MTVDVGHLVPSTAHCTIIRHLLIQSLILGIPRGAMPMAKTIADALDGDLDVLLVKKLGAPGNPEMAIGAVDESGDQLRYRIG